MSIFCILKSIWNTTKTKWKSFFQRSMVGDQIFLLSVQLSMWGRIAHNWNIKKLALRVLLSFEAQRAAPKPQKKLYFANFFINFLIVFHFKPTTEQCSIFFHRYKLFGEIKIKVFVVFVLFLMFCFVLSQIWSCYKNVSTQPYLT